MPSRFHVPVPTHQFVCRRPLATSFALVLAGVLLLGLYSSHHRAAGRGSDATIPDIGTMVPDTSLDPRIISLDLVGADWERAVARLDTALFAEADMLRSIDSARTQLVEDQDELGRVRVDLVAAEATADSLDAEIANLEDVLRQRAIALFVSHGDEDTAVLNSPHEAASEARVSHLAAEVDDNQFATRTALLDRQENIEAHVRALSARRLQLETTIASLGAGIGQSLEEIEILEGEIERAIEAVRDTRRSAQIPGVDFSVVALDAYLKAETFLAEARPACRIEWWMIAGVGRVESRHGQLGGRTIRDDGRTSSDIIGIALDGGPGVRAIVDTDGGALDRDPEWDRAVGPMQFIPETWRIRSWDGNDDGRKDPHNLYDAALTTGRYLCQLGEDLSESRSLRDAYFGYNTSTDYVDSVHAHALRYRELELEEVDPVEPTEPPSDAVDVGGAVENG